MLGLPYNFGFRQWVFVFTPRYIHLSYLHKLFLILYYLNIASSNSNQVSQSYKTTESIIASYILSFLLKKSCLDVSNSWKRNKNNHLPLVPYLLTLFKHC